MFLHDIRSTLIPTIGIVVSIVGTFAFMAVVGFSINLITLFALVLAIGTVVDGIFPVFRRWGGSRHLRDGGRSAG